MHATIVLGHGSRSPEATAQFIAVVDRLRARGVSELVLPAFMELASPSLPDAFAAAAAAGATAVTVLPCFLFQGNHIKRDVPALLAELHQQYPALSLRYGTPLGTDERVVDILCARLEEAGNV